MRKSGFRVLARELLYTAVTMNTSLTTSAVRTLIQDARPLQKTAQTEKPEQDRGKSSTTSDFSQMLGMAQAHTTAASSAATNATTNATSSSSTNAAPSFQSVSAVAQNTMGLQVLTSTAPADVASTKVLADQAPLMKLMNTTAPTKEAGPTFLGVQTAADAPIDNEAAQELTKVLSNAADTSKDGKKSASTEKDAVGQPIKTDKSASDDKKVQPLAAQIKDSEALMLEQQELVAAKGQNKNPETLKARTDDASSVAANAALNKAQQEMPQVQAIQASVNRVVDSVEQGRQIHAAATDPADALDTMVTIVKDGTTLAVKFEPHGLGKLDINLSLEKGMVHGNINVHDEATKKLIENNMQQILDGLQKEGLSVGGFSVSLQKGDSRAWSGENGYRNSAKAGAAETEAVRNADRIASNGLVSIFI